MNTLKRIDFVALRKRAGMSQRKLAELLQVRPSFLSAIENGRSRMPEEKLERVKEIFELDSLDGYMMEEKEGPSVPFHTHGSEQEDTLTRLLNHFHDLAHRREKAENGVDGKAAARIDFLVKRNDRLSQKVDDLRDETDRLRTENLRLKELLIKNGIQY